MQNAAGPQTADRVPVGPLVGAQIGRHQLAAHSLYGCGAVILLLLFSEAMWSSCGGGGAALQRDRPG